MAKPSLGFYKTLPSVCHVTPLFPTISIAWLSGALTIDEAVTLCQSVCSGNPSTLAWIMLPQYYTSSSKHSVLKNRRLLEDKLLGCLFSNIPVGKCFKSCELKQQNKRLIGFSAGVEIVTTLLRRMDVYEVSLNYADAQHSGDKRKKSQQCILYGITSYQRNTKTTYMHMCTCVCVCLGCGFRHSCTLWPHHKRSFLEVQSIAGLDRGHRKDQGDGFAESRPRAQSCAALAGTFDKLRKFYFSVNSMALVGGCRVVG